MKKKIIVFVETGVCRTPEAREWYLEDGDVWQSRGRLGESRSILSLHELEIDADKPASVEVKYTPGARVWRECVGEEPRCKDLYVETDGRIGKRHQDYGGNYSGTHRLAESREPAKVEVMVK